MPIAVTIFGVAKRDTPATFCYAFFRHVRGPGDYPAPTLPDSIKVDGIRRLPIADDLDLELVTWDNIFDDAADGSLQSGLDSGHFDIPAECPIEPNAEMTGQPFGPILIAERGYRIRTSGAGILHVKGFAVDNSIDRVTAGVEAVTGPALMPIALKQAIELIASQSGLGPFFAERRRIGVVDQFYRTQNVAGISSTLFDVIGDGPDFRNKNPMHRVRIRRDSADPDKLFRLHATLKNFDEILNDVLVDLPAGQPEILVEADSHVTNIEVVAFDDAGEILDRVSSAFTQSFHVELTVRGKIDELPRLFPGAPESPDLHRRARLHHTVFEGPSVSNRSGGLDALTCHRKRLDMLIGVAGQPAESRWLESCAENQIEVIRWIKTKLEKPGITKAFLVDPFLGSEALRRVIARQGNEIITLTILVSPGGINPDADTTDKNDSGDYLSKLAATAQEWSDRLCGQISIIHIKRGGGAKQAFHDRYLSVVDQQGMPTVYLLSNSLSRAAGNWPFAISELDRITSQQVHHYILRLIEGDHGDRDLHRETIWKSVKAADAPIIASPDASQHLSADELPERQKSAGTFLQDLRNVVIHNACPNAVENTVKAFIASWPHGVDTNALANDIFNSVNEEIIVFISKLFATGTTEQADVAGKLDDKLLNKFLESLPRNAQKGAGCLHMRGERSDYLRHIGQTLAKKPASTNYVRGELNPVLHTLVQLIESERFDFDLVSEAVETGICLVSVGLEVAIASHRAMEDHRIGLATDYVHWIGRLTRSAEAHSCFRVGEDIPEWRNDLAFAARQVLAARTSLGDKLEAPIQRVLQDDFVLSDFKDMLMGNTN